MESNNDIILTGWKHFDELSCGFKRGKVYCLASPPFMVAKTFLNSVGQRIEESGIKVISFEGSVEDYNLLKETEKIHPSVLLLSSDISVKCEDELRANLNVISSIALKFRLVVIIYSTLNWDDFEIMDVMCGCYYTLPVDLLNYQIINNYIEQYLVLVRPEFYGIMKSNTGEDLHGVAQVLFLRNDRDIQPVATMYYIHSQRKFYDKSEYHKIDSELLKLRIRNDEISNLIDAFGLVANENCDEADLTDYYEELSREECFKDEFGGTYSKDRKVLFHIDASDGIDEYKIADGTEIIDANCINIYERIRRLVIPSSIRKIMPGMNIGIVDEIEMNSPFYICKDGLILTRDGKDVVSHFGVYDTYNIPSSVERLQTCSLFRCSATTIVADNVSVVEDYSIGSCLNLKEIRLPNVSYIGDNAFNYCPSLERIILNAYIERMGQAVFGYCENLKEILFDEGDGVLSPSCDSHFTTSDELGNTYLINYYDSSIVTILNHSEHCRIPEELGYITSSDGNDETSYPFLLRTIDVEAFSGRHSIKSIEIPKNIISIRDGAFEECSSLEGISLPPNLKRLRYRTFFGCGSLKYLTLPSSLKVIEDFCCGMCLTGKLMPLSNIELPDGILHVGEKAFDGTMINSQCKMK